MKKVLSVFIFITVMISSISLNSKLYDNIFIIINDDVVTFNEFKINYIKLKNDLLRRGMPIPKNAKQMLFDQLIGEKIIAQTAVRKEVFISETEVDESIERVKRMNNLSDSDFKQALKLEGKTYQEIEEDYRKRILSEKIMSIELRPRITQPTEEESLAYYKKNKSKMNDPKRIRISHILIKDKPGASLKEKIRIKDKAKKILKKALKGKNFVKLARSFSEHEESSKVGGDIGYKAKGEWLPEIDKQVFSIRKGSIGREVFTSRWGFHIIKITDKKRKKSVSFDNMRSRIENFLINQKMKDEFDKWIEEKKQNSYFEVIFPKNEKYVYDYDKWKKKNSKKVISNKKLMKKISSLKL